MDPTTARAIGKILVTRGRETVSWGTGFLVSADLVLTALHVVADRAADPPSPRGEAVTVLFPDRTTKASIVADRWDRRGDWVLLRCESPPPADPIVLLRQVEPNVSWRTRGFPEAKSDGIDIGG